MNDNPKSVVLMIESGKPLDLVKAHIADRIRVKAETHRLLDELGLAEGARYWPCSMTGVVFAVAFPKGKHHPDFKAPSRKNGSCRPKKGSHWEKRFAEQKGYANDSEQIAKAFDVPTCIETQHVDGTTGWRHIGRLFSPCGFLFLSPEGPYAMWIPDVDAEVCEALARGAKVEPMISTPVIEGTRRIEPEEWDIVVAQHKLAEKAAAKKEAAA